MPASSQETKLKPRRAVSSSQAAYILIIIAVIALFACTRFLSGDGKGWRSIISSDGTGYYAYLPSLVIYGDTSWEKFTVAERKAYGRPDYNPKYLALVNGRLVNKYFSGESILLLPFFLVALLFSWISGSEVDGLSFWFQCFIGIGSLFYLLAGLHYLKKILKTFSFSADVTAFAMIAVFAGTNLFYYALGQPSMSHVYSFFAINAFTWSIIKFNTSPSNRLRILSGIFLAIIILLRPTNALVVLVVPLFLSAAPLSAFIKQMINLKHPGFIISFILILAVQPLLWHLQTGRWLIMSYPDEGFYFLRPRIADFLFSFRRGWFIYTPLMLLILPGIFLLPGKKRKNLSAFFLFFALLIYLSSSWWCWYYADGFGQRSIIDFYGLFAVLIAAPLSRMEGGRMRLFGIVFAFACICLNLFQTWQYRMNYISPDNMNRVKYFHVFLRTADEYRNCLGGCTEEPFYKSDLRHPLARFLTGFEKLQPYWMNCESRIVSRDSRIVNRDPGAGVNAVFLFTNNMEFGPGIAIPYDSLRKEPSPLYCDVSMKVYDSIPAASNQAMLVFAVDSLNRSYNYYNAVRLNDIPLSGCGSWRSIHYSLNLPKIINPKAILKIYLWNPAKGIFMVDDVEIRIFGRE